MGLPKTSTEMRSILGKHIVKIKFTKKDGTKRDMKCTTNPDVLSIKNIPHSSKKKETRGTDNTVIVVFDLSINEWRSFDFERVIGLEIEE